VFDGYDFEDVAEFLDFCRSVIMEYEIWGNGRYDTVRDGMEWDCLIIYMDELEHSIS